MLDKYSNAELAVAADILALLAESDVATADPRGHLLAEIAHREVIASYENGPVIEVSIDSPEFDATCGPVPMPAFFHGSMTPRS